MAMGDIDLKVKQEIFSEHSAVLPTLPLSSIGRPIVIPRFLEAAKEQ